MCMAKVFFTSIGWPNSEHCQAKERQDGYGEAQVIQAIDKQYTDVSVC